MRLTKTELRWGRAGFETIFPGSEEAGLVSVREMNIEGFLVELIANLPFKAALGLRAALWIVALAPLFLLRRFVTLVSLSHPEREAIVARLYASPIYLVRQLVMILKAMGAMLYAGAPAVRERMRLSRRERKVSLVTLRVKRPVAA